MKQRRRQFTVIQGKKKRKRRGEKAFYSVLAVAVGLLVLQAFYSLTRDVVSARFAKTMTAEMGILEQKLPVQGVLVRDERVVAAPVTGELRWLAREGERLAVGAPVAKITPDTGAAWIVSAPSPGVAVYQLDGLEGNIQFSSVKNLDLTVVSKIAYSPERVADGEKVTQGSLIFKMVGNYKWLFVTELSQKEFESVEGAATRRLRFSFAEPEDVTAAVAVLRKEENSVLLSFEVKDDLEGCFLERFTRAEIITKRTQGVLLPESAIVRQGVETGIYTVEKTMVRYHPVTILDQSEEKVVVEGVKIGSQIITNPQFVRVGQRI